MQIKCKEKCRYIWSEFMQSEAKEGFEVQIIQMVSNNRKCILARL